MRTHFIAILFAALLLTACSGITVAPGDTVSVTYTGTLHNGTVFDSNDPAHAADVPHKPSNLLVPMTVTIGQGRLIPGFEGALVGMREGELKTVTIKAIDAYGSYKAELARTVPKIIVQDRFARVQRHVTTTRADLDGQLTKPLVLGSIISTQNFQYRVENLTNTTVALCLVAASNETLQLTGTSWDSTIVNITNDTIVFRQDVLDKSVVQTENGPYIAHVNETHLRLESALQVGRVIYTELGEARVTKENDNGLTVDFNHPLAGMDLTFDIRVDAIERRE